MILRSACAKVILCGEHFVLHGCPAVAVPVRSRRLALAPRGPPGASGQDDELPRQAWIQARAAFGLPPASAFPFAVRSSIRPGAGLGSSAALCVALARAAARDAGARPAPEGIASLATGLEDLFHGRSSGLDPSVVAFERPLKWSPDARCEVLPWPPGLEVVVAIAPGLRSTADAVARVAAFAAGHPARFARMREEASGLVSALADALQRDRPVDGADLRRNHALLAELGLSSPPIDALVRAMEHAGALGSKLSGAGLSGAVVALAETEQAPRVARAALAAGAVEAFVAGLD